MTTHGHLNNWAILVTFLATAGFCYIASKWTPAARTARRVRRAKLVRLRRRCTWLEGNWRKAARERDAAQMAEMAVRVENEHLTDDLATAVREAQVVREQLGYVSGQLARQLNHPSQRRDAELFERLEKDFS
jgi:hypothetical protein